MTATSTPRRGAEGSIRPFPGARNPDRHQIRWTDLTGKRCAKMVDSLEDAKRELRAVLHDRDLGVPHAVTRRTLASWLPVWLAGKVDLRPRTLVRYRLLIAHWTDDPIASRRLPELEPGHVQGALARMSRKGVSNAEIVYALSILRQALETAMRQGYVGRNVTRLVTPPRVETRPIEPPRGDDRTALLEAIRTDRLEALWTIAIYAGLRQGEILALRWADVDLDAEPPAITVRGSLEYGTDRVGPPKTRRGYRRLPVHAQVADALRRHRSGLGVIPHPTAFVFATRTGRPLHARNVLGWWYELCARAGTRRYRMHDLRHAALTHLAEHNELVFVSRYAGHSSVRITGDVYAHNAVDGIRLESA